MAVPARWRTLAGQIDAAVESRLTDLATRQTAYAQTRSGRLWQGVRWPEPADGADGDRDAARKPTDQNEDWTAFGLSLPARLPMALSVDVFLAPAPVGWGWTITAYVRLDGALWARTWASGSDPLGRAHGWQRDDG
ncbi:MAG: hypothetical protein IT341_07070 [Chloroflexi bacterium]|nr:hypothetical protein [Chloroflexota bacterium]